MTDLTCWTLPKWAQDWRRLPRIQDVLARGAFHTLLARLDHLAQLDRVDGETHYYTYYVPGDWETSQAENPFMENDKIPPEDRQCLLDLASAFFADFEIPNDGTLEAPQAPVDVWSCLIVPEDRAKYRICDLYFAIHDRNDGLQPMSFRFVKQSAHDTANCYLWAKANVFSWPAVSDDSSASEEVSPGHRRLLMKTACR